MHQIVEPPLVFSRVWRFRILGISAIRRHQFAHSDSSVQFFFNHPVLKEDLKTMSIWGKSKSRVSLKKTFENTRKFCADVFGCHQ
jgi:hypothetical protein